MANSYSASKMTKSNTTSFCCAPPPYLGTFSRDRIPADISNCAIIINLDDHTGPGTHWTAFYNDGAKPAAYYCDSYGLVPPSEITDKLPRDTKLIYNTGILQPSNALCGWIAVMTLCELGAGRQFTDLITQFDPMPTARNIKLVRKYFA